MVISKLCYELYKVDWKHSHDITPEVEMETIKDYYEGLVDDEEVYTYNDYIEECGYNGELYVCYEEFLNNEYYDEKYMQTLLNNDELIKKYYEDISNQGNTENESTDIIRCRVDGGVLIACKSQDPEYPGIDIEFVADYDTCADFSRPRVLMEKPKSGDLRTLVWNNKNEGDYTLEIEFK